MGFNLFIPVEITAQSKILVSQIIINDEKSKIASRFGITYDCSFNNENITIGLSNPLKLKFKQMDEARAFIPYSRVESIKFSVVRLPVVSPLQHGHSFALDVIIQTKENSFYLETAAFKLIPSIVEIAHQKNIPVIDPIGIIDLCSGLCLEGAKEKLSPIYNDLMNQYNLQNVRNLDDLSRVNN